MKEIKCRTIFRKWQKEYSVIGNIRVAGAMIGIEFVRDSSAAIPNEPCPELVKNIIQECTKHGLLVEDAGTYGNVIRFLCPLVVTDKQLEQGLEILHDSKFVNRREYKDTGVPSTGILNFFHTNSIIVTDYTSAVLEKSSQRFHGFFYFKRPFQAVDMRPCSSGLMETLCL